MACPLPKQQRSNYIHLDSIEPQTWGCLVDAMRDAADSVEITSLPPVEIDDSTPVDVAITGQPISVIAGPDAVYPVQFSDSASIDAFARLRVSNPVTLFDSQHQYDLNRILWENSVTNTSGNATVTHDAASSEVDLYVEAEDDIIRQTRQYFRYQPGKSSQIMMTFVFSPQDANLSQHVGYHDSNDGIFLHDTGTEYQIVLRSSQSGSPVDTGIPQASWNVDPFDGTGPSGYTLDFTKAQILIIDLEWLGVGRVRCGFVVDGIPYYAHQFLNANNLASVYMTTANLPLRYRAIGGAGLASGKTMKCICAQVSSEGGFEVARGLLFAATNGSTDRSTGSGALLPLVSIRPKATFNSIVNRGLIFPESLSVFSGTDSINWQLIWGAAIVGGSWVSVNDDSITEMNLTGTSLTGGIAVDSGFLGGSNQAQGAISAQSIARYPLSLDIAGAHPTTPYADTLTLAAQLFAGSGDCAGTIQFREIR